MQELLIAVFFYFMCSISVREYLNEKKSILIMCVCASVSQRVVGTMALSHPLSLQFMMKNTDCT